MLLEARAKAGAQERARLAREIHDGVAQDLAGLGYRLDDLATAPGLTPSERCEIREIRLALSQSLMTLRRSIFDLRNEAVDFLMEVGRLVEAIGNEGIQVSFDCTSASNPIDANIARHLYAIAIEALANVVHHANATRLEFSFANSGEYFQMTIEDNGIGNVEAKQFSYGLATMRERATLIGAECQIASPASGGTKITVRAPKP